MRRNAVMYDVCSRLKFTGDILCIIGVAHSRQGVRTACTCRTGSC